MAEQDKIIRYVGKLGDTIGYERDGKFFLRSAPQQVNQTPATCRASRRFGRYSAKGRLVRHAFYPQLDVRCDTTHINRLNKLLIKAAGDHMAAKGFRFNEQAGIDRFFSIMPELTKNGTLHIPAQDIARHHQFIALEVKAIAVRIDFNRRCVTGSDTVLMTINPNEHFDGTNIPLDVPGEGTLILTLQVRGILRDGLTCNKQYLAADIVAVIAPPKRKRPKVHTHLQRTTAEQSIQIPLTGTYTSPSTVQRE